MQHNMVHGFAVDKNMRVTPDKSPKVIQGRTNIDTIFLLSLILMKESFCYIHILKEKFLRLT